MILPGYESPLPQTARSSNIPFYPTLPQFASTFVSIPPHAHGYGGLVTTQVAVVTAVETEAAVEAEVDAEIEAAAEAAAVAAVVVVVEMEWQPHRSSAHCVHEMA